jgi:hypothetical protein
MAGMTEAQGTTVGTPAPQAPPTPHIPPMPSRAGAATGATAAGQAVSGSSAQGQGVSQDAPTPTPEAIILQPPPYREARRNDIPGEVIPIIGMVMGTGIAIALGYPVVRMITKVIERRTDKAYVKGANVEAQLRALQESVDTMAIEMERIGEAQRFQAKLMSERKPEALPPG